MLPPASPLLNRAHFIALVPLALALTACHGGDDPGDPLGQASEAISAPNLFPTGVSATGALLAVGATDPHYTLTASNDITALAPGSIYVVTPNAAWVGNSTTGQWVSPFRNTMGSADPGDYTYTTTFTVGAPPSTASITGTWSCDNTCTASINGKQFAALTAVDSYQATAAFTIPSADLIEGTNTVSFAVVNTVPGPTGLAVLSVTESEGCILDSDCSATQFCDTATSTCTAKYPNGEGIPNASATNPTPPGECASGVVDAADGLCGYPNGDGAPNASATNPTPAGDCRSGVVDPNTGLCGYANGDGITGASAANPTPVGDCVSGVVDAKDGLCGYANGDGIAGASSANPTPVSDCRSGVVDPKTGLCGYANGDGSPGASATNPTPPGECASGVVDPNDGLCGYANGDGSPGASATNPTPPGDCRSGAVNPKTGLCGYANGDGSPGASATNPTPPGECASGVVDPNDGLCGYANGDGPCMPATGPVVCRSGACTEGGGTLCGPSGSSSSSSSSSSGTGGAAGTSTASSSSTSSGVGGAASATSGSSAGSGASSVGFEAQGGCAVPASGGGRSSEAALPMLAALASIFAARRRRRC